MRGCEFWAYESYDKFDGYEMAYAVNAFHITTPFEFTPLIFLFVLILAIR